MTTPTPVVLDCDPGHDDVFAIWLAAGSPLAELKAITTVAGNGALADTTRNARIACTVAGIDSVPIAAGADGPLTRKLRTAPTIHGANALGGPVLPEPTVPLDERPAIAVIAEVLRASGRPVTLVATGPLTNIAQLILNTDRGTLARVDRIVWMGGSTGRGNTTPYAEFNAWADPEAADVVVRSGIPLTMVGLNVTHQALVTDAVASRIEAIGNAAGQFGAELIRFFRGTYAAVDGLADAPLHDPVAMALALDPAVATTVRARLDIELTGTETAGATCVDLLDRLRRAANADIAQGLDAGHFWDLLIGAVAALA